MKKSCVKYAVHKEGTNIFGSLCTYENEAQDLLNDLKTNIINMPDEEKALFKVAKVELVWDED